MLPVSRGNYYHRRKVLKVWPLFIVTTPGPGSIPGDSKTFFCRMYGGIKQSIKYWSLVVAQLTAWSLPVPEDPGLNPVIGNFYLTIISVNCLKKRRNKRKEAGNGPFFKKTSISSKLAKVKR